MEKQIWLFSSGKYDGYEIDRAFVGPALPDDCNAEQEYLKEHPEHIYKESNRVHVLESHQDDFRNWMIQKYHLEECVIYNVWAFERNYHPAAR